MSDVSLEKLTSLSKRRGFIYQGSEIYGGLAGTWDYGPLGVQLKRNISNLWWKMFVEDRDDMLGLDSAILMNQKVWAASGHTDTFTDPIVEDEVTHVRYRADHLLEDLGYSTEGLNLNQIKDIIREKGIKSPDGNELSDPETFNMMLKTVTGPKYTTLDRKKPGGLKAKVEFLDGNEKPEVAFDLNDEFSELGGFMFYDPHAVSYLRPETAQGIFVNFRNVVDSFYPDIPFGIAQIGKAFRNEISPRDFIFRTREFEQMEIEYFVKPDEWEKKFESWRKDFYDWFKLIGLDEQKIHELEVSAEDRAHYSSRTIDFEFDFPFGKKELYGLAYRTDHDLSAHQKHSGQNMEYTIKGSNEKFVPHVIEPTFGVDRTVLAVLASCYREDEVGGEKRTYLKLPFDVAPVKYAVSPLLKNKPELVEKAREVYTALQKKYGTVMWDDSGNIGKRYRRQDEIGTPYCVVIDFETLEDNTVTIRDRDTTKQKRVSVSDLQ